MAYKLRFREFDYLDAREYMMIGLRSPDFCNCVGIKRRFSWPQPRSLSIGINNQGVIDSGITKQ